MSSSLGLGILATAPNLNQGSSDVPHSAFSAPSWKGRSVEIRSHARSSARESTDLRNSASSLPSGAMSRLLLELERTESQVKRLESKQSGLREVVNGDGTGSLHRRSATMGSPSVLPRTSSIRRRHQSVDICGQHDRKPSHTPSEADRLEAVAELSPTAGSEIKERAQAIQTSTRGQCTCSSNDGRPGRARSNSGLTSGQPTKTKGSKLIRSRFLIIALNLFIIVYQALFFTFEAPYLWHAITPALPLVASSLFLILNLLLLQMHILKSLRFKLLQATMALLTPTLAYCIALSAVKLTFLTRSSDQGASAPGIHFHRDRNGGDHFDEVVRDMPISVILFALGIAGMLASIGLATMLGWSVMRRRRQMEGHRIDPF